MDNSEIKDLTTDEQKALFMKLLASKLRTAKRSPLSFSQERIWSITQLNPDNTSFNISNSMYIFGELDEAVLEKSLKEIIRRQEILRSIFFIENENLVQVALPVFSFRLKIIDVSAIASDKAALEQTMNSERKQSFDLSKDLPFRAVLLRLAQHKHILILIMHQIVIDAESWPIVIQELASAYQALKKGTKPSLPNLAMQYADYANWQRERLKGSSYTLLNEYWRDKFQEGIAPMQLPTDRLHTSQLDTTAYTYKFKIEPEILTQLKQLSQKEKVSLFVTLLTTFNCLLYMYTKQEHFMIFTSVSAKNRPELKTLMGLFSNLVPLQLKIIPNRSLRQIIESIHQEVNDAVAHQELPFDKITESIKLKVPEQRINYTSLFQVMFTLRYVDAFDYNRGDIRLEPIEMTLEKELNFEIRLGMREMTSHMECILTYNATVFEESTIRQVVDNYLILLETCVNAVDLHLSELPVFQSIGRHSELLAGKRANELQNVQITPYVAPRDVAETKLALLWQEILGAEKVGIHDNFFELGGHSLNATILISRLHQTFQVEVPLPQIFLTPTIAGLAEYLVNGSKSFYTLIPPVAEQEYYPMSAAQKRLYILHQIDPSNLSYNMPNAIIVEGNLDWNRLEGNFQKLIKRHEAFRTSFEIINGEQVQMIHPEVELKIHYQEAQEVQLPEIIAGFIRPFDLKMAPLLRVGLIRISDAKHLLLFDMHHIISDGTSFGILIKEFIESYDGKDLPELRIQYKDYAVWQNEFLQREVLKQQEEYWLGCFRDEIPFLNLPTDYPRPAIQSFAGDRIQFEIGSELTRKCNRMAVETGTTLYMLLLAVYNILLSKYTGQEDIIIGSPAAGRPHPDLEQIIGVFINTLAMRNHPAAQKTFQEFLDEVRENSLKAYENQDYQFEELVGKLALRRDLSHSPLFDVIFILQNTKRFRVESSSLKFTPYNFENRTVQFDLTLNTFETDGKLLNTFEYSTKLFLRGTIERLIDSFQMILQSVMENPSVTIADIEVLTPAGKRKILENFNQTTLDYPEDKLIHELFEDQAAKNPDQVALRFQDDVLTYRELDERANSLARILRLKGVKPDQPVGIIVNRSFEMIVGILGILKAGGAYLPIDPAYPEERIRYMLDESQTKILLTREELVPTGDSEVTIIALNHPEIYQENHSGLERVNNSRDLAYLIYTSGSTGNPKGVMIEHRAVHNFITGITARIEFNLGKSILALTTISFDIFGLETLLPLARGLSIIIAPETAQLDPGLLGELIIKHQIQMLQATPSRLQLLLGGEHSRSCLENLTEIMIGGEALPESLLHEIQKLTRAKIYNMYGPTETTIWSTVKDLTAETAVNIGTPIANTQIYVVDPNNKPQPVGVAGELCIAGDGLARGYWGSLELTALKFVFNPFTLQTSNFKLPLMYRTGDLARWLPDGNIEFLGRLDHQVKIRGNRIELGEIENRLLQHQAIKSAVVIDREDTAKNKYLCTYLVYEGEKELTVSELKDYLAKKLPDYMIPSYFVRLERIPLTPNGKIDRRQLPKPGGNVNTGTVYEAPGNETEAKLVDIWQQILEVNPIGIHDNFFDMGGHSLKATILVDRIHQELNVEIPLRQIFQTPTISGLAEYLVKGAESFFALIPPVAEQEYYPMPADQKRGQNPFYNLKDFQLFAIDQANQKVLQIKLQNEITTYLCHALPLCVILADDKLLPWYYEHFINLFSIVDESGYLKLEFLEYRASYKEVMYEVYLGYHLLTAESNIIHFIIDKINSGYYVIINVDEYYLSVKSRYQKEHFVHHSLVYGYDNIHKKLLAIGFNTEQIFAPITFDYEPFIIAYEEGKQYYKESAPWAENNAVELLKLKAYQQEYPFALQKFLFQLDNYLAATGDDAIIFTFMMDKQKVKYGIQIYEEIITRLEDLLEGQITIDYRAIHLLSEHKKCLYSRLQYIIIKYNLTGNLVKAIEDYWQIVEQVELIRKKFLQFNYSDTIVPADLQNIVKETVATFKLIKDKEQMILLDVSRQLHSLITGAH